jgi:hypothetical protein
MEYILSDVEEELIASMGTGFGTSMKLFLGLSLRTH